jgi:sugar transferase (PEP-CTERM/EpsH1 system associated)
MYHGSLTTAANEQTPDERVIADRLHDAACRVRVAHIVSTLNIGGLEKVVLNLMQHCNRDLFEPCVVCLGEAGALAPLFADLQVPVLSLGPTNRIRGGKLVPLLKILSKVKPHVVHTHNPSPHLYGIVAGRLLGAPALVHTKHGRNIFEVHGSRLRGRVASWLSDCIVPVSADARDVAREREGVPLNKLHVIRNGIDLAAFSFRDHGVPQTRCRAIHVARLNRVKDQATLLRAVRMVVAQRPDFTLDIVGDGEIRSELEELAAQLEIAGCVQFLGYRNDVRDRLSSADVFLLSSISEGISLTLLEAMAVGLPVVATDVGGNREVVVHGETGLLVPAKSPRELANAILRLANDRPLAHAMGVAGRKRVEAHFDLRKVVAEYEDLYLRILARSRRGRRVLRTVRPESALNTIGRGAPL